LVDRQENENRLYPNLATTSVRPDCWIQRSGSLSEDQKLSWSVTERVKSLAIIKSVGGAPVR
jgi:hypothetical protein